MNSTASLQREEIHHILLWMPNWIGDVVLTLPAVQSLRQRYPDARITAVARPPADEILSSHPLIDTVIKIPYRPNDGILDRLKFGFGLRKYRFDLGVVFPNSLQSAVQVFLSGTRHRLGHNTEGRGMLLTHPLPVTDELKRKQYRVDYFFQILAPLKLEAPRAEFLPLNANAQDRSIAEILDAMQLEPQETFISVAPGTSKPERGWHADRFGGLCQRLIQDHAMKIVLLGTADENDLLQRIRDHCLPEMIRVVPPLGLREIAALIGNSVLFIGNDSGMMHLAAMVETPVVGIFGPGSPAASGPWIDPKKRELVSKDYFCSPCRQRFFKECQPSPSNKPYCLEDIGVDDVLEAVRRLLSRNREKGVASE